MPNITIALDDDIHRRAKIYSAKTGISLSKAFREYVLSVTDGDADASNDVISRYARLEVSAKDAMSALGFVCLEDLMCATVCSGFSLPHVDRKVADSMVRAALKGT